ncbi:hypothetical protein BD413DRAFT_617853 [Trametes elegans]|nr:hypothetical protein BD413DRAFT_617853 [Trametes elegans]
MQFTLFVKLAAVVAIAHAGAVTAGASIVRNRDADTCVMQVCGDPIFPSCCDGTVCSSLAGVMGATVPGLCTMDGCSGLCNSDADCAGCGVDAKCVESVVVGTAGAKVCMVVL